MQEAAQNKWTQKFPDSCQIPWHFQLFQAAAPNMLFKEQRTKFAEHAFSATSASVWNAALPADVRLETDTAVLNANYPFTQ